MIDVYDWWSLMAINDACSRSSHGCHDMSGSSTSMTIPTRTTPIYEPRVQYWMARWMPDEFASGDKKEFSSDTRERRKWINRVSELGTWGKLFNWVVLSSLSVLLFSFPCLITSLNLGSVQMALARVFTTSGWHPSGGRVSPYAGSTEW